MKLSIKEVPLNDKEKANVDAVMEVLARAKSRILNAEGDILQHLYKREYLNLLAMKARGKDD